ncbi:MAG TPA: hypothetical protein VGG16_29955 [Streptosporangiaceae bacterium]
MPSLTSAVRLMVRVWLVVSMGPTMLKWQESGPVRQTNVDDRPFVED